MLTEDITDMMPIDNSVAPGLPSAVYVVNWDKMVTKNPTRAAVLQALANLQLRSTLNNGPLPTQNIILQEVVTCGLKLATGEKIPVRLSLSSEKEINRHITDHLIPQGYVLTRKDYTQNTKRGRGGPTSPWQVVAISAFIKERMKNNE